MEIKRSFRHPDKNNENVDVAILRCQRLASTRLRLFLFPARVLLLWMLLLTPATSAPSLSWFDLDMGSGLLTLTFSEAVQSATLNATAVQFQDNLTSAKSRYRLTGVTEGVFEESNASETVLVALAEHDLLSVLGHEGLAIDAESTWLTLEQRCVRGAVDNQPSTATRQPVRVETYEADGIPPALEAYLLDMDDGVLSLQFSEPMNRSSLDLRVVVIQTTSNELDAEATLSLVNIGTSVLPDPCPEVDASLSASTTVAPSSVPTYLIPPPSTATLAPSITSSWPSPTAANATVLTVCSGTTDVSHAVWINVSLGRTNLNAIKAAYPLASQEQLTFLALSGAIARDHAGNAVLTQFWTVYEGRAPLAWSRDVTPPYLTTFAVDLDTGTVELAFSETVDASELDVSCVILQERADNRTGGLDHALRGTRTSGSRTIGGDGAVLTVALSREDLDEVKRLPRLLVDKATAHIALPCAGGFRDTAFPANYGVPTPRTSALVALAYAPDVTRPTLVSGALDLDGPTLVLEFDETVDWPC